MKVVILAGGYGTRLLEETVVKPKPMVEIGNRPMLWHIMSIYAAHGFQEFVIALGYKGNWVKSFFLSHHHMQRDLTVNLSDGAVTYHDEVKQDWKVHLIETGQDTGTAGRLMRLQKILNNKPFMVTYGDGVSNVDVTALVKHHKQSGKIVTVTAVRPPARFGVLEFDESGDNVINFGEKPQASGGWINGGFFVVQPEVFKYLTKEESFWEQEPLQTIAKDGQLSAFKHEGFWQCMDTLRDVRYLEDLWNRNCAPWKVWKD